MMKILHVIPTLNKGGAERIALDMCLELQAQGHTVKLVTLYAANQYSFLTEKLDYHVVNSKVTLSLLGKNQVDVSELQAQITDFQPDVIHTHLFESEIHVAFCVLPPHTKRVMHFHDNMIQMQAFSWRVFWNKQQFTNFYERKLVLANLPKNTTAIGISNDSLQYISRVLPQRIGTQKLFNAIDLKRFKFSSELREPDKIVMIGSLTQLKGQALAIETIAALKQRELTVSLHVIGEGKQREELILLAKKLNVLDSIHFLGAVDHPETHLSDASIYMHTSFSEAFGLVLIEAMACCLPIVCTDGKGNRDLIREGENGFMIWERNPELIADKIQFLLENEDERLRMGIEAHRFAQDFGMENYVKKLVEVYQSN